MEKPPTMLAGGWARGRCPLLTLGGSASVSAVQPDRSSASARKRVMLSSRTGVVHRMAPPSGRHDLKPPKSLTAGVLSGGMGFDHVLGQPTAVATLVRALEAGVVHHAYRFEGPAGVGKELAALAFARALLCEGGDRLGCGRCEACRRA